MLPYLRGMSDLLDVSSITLDDLLDTAILTHGYFPYKRDYYFHLEMGGIKPWAGQYLLTLRHCYEMSSQIILNSDALVESWDDCFISMEAHKNAGEPEGYIWGTNWTLAYPGFSIIDISAKAEAWTQKLNKRMLEMVVETETIKMNLIFHEWSLKKMNDESGLISQAIFQF